jgi:hypothetical protein
MRTVCVVSILAIILLNFGCATIITGKHQSIPISSDPPGLKVKSSTGETIITPGEITFVRNRNYVLIAECPNGKVQQKQLKHGIQGWFFANILLGGLPGMIVDLCTGACDELKPKEVHFACE